MIARLTRIASAAWPWLLASLGARTAGLVCGIALLALPAWGIAAAMGGAEVPLVPLACALVALAAVKGALRYLEQFLGHRAAFDLIADMRLRFYDAVVPLAPGELDEGAGELTSIAARDIDRVEVFFAHTIVPAVTAVLVPVAVVACALAVGPAEAAVVLAGFVVGGVIVPLLGRAAAGRAARSLLAERAAISQQVAEDVAAITELRTLGAEQLRLSALNARDERAGRMLRAAGGVQAARAALGVLWPFGVVIALLAMSPADAGAHIVLAAAVLGAVPALSSVEAFAKSLPLALAAARRYLGVLDRAPRIVDPAEPRPLPDGPLGVAFEGAGFGHRGAETVVLDGLSFEVPAGGRLAVVGESGSGKSTVAALLLRVHERDAGRILLGGVDVRETSMAELRRAIALVEQRVVLTGGTVLDNLRLGNPALGEEGAWRALEDAALAADIRSHPDGLGARVGEDALALSGGQRQRLSLARALAREPRVLVLDEATSHQDPLTQEAIRRAIASRPDLTAIVIAHRSDAVTGISEVLRMPEGRRETRAQNLGEG